MPTSAGSSHPSRALEFAEVRMHGVVARRRVLHFGWSYAFDSARIAPGPEIPDFLLGVRERAGRIRGGDAGRSWRGAHHRYPAGAGIGWHRDAPAFGIVAAVSLLAPCRMRFRRGEDGPLGDHGNHARAALRVRHYGRVPFRMAALHPAHEGAALLDHVPDFAASSIAASSASLLWTPLNARLPITNKGTP